MSGITSLCLSGNFFFQPLQFHLEPSDLLVQIGFYTLAVLLVLGVVAENLRSFFEQLLFPLADLVRVDTVFACKFAEGFYPLYGFQSDLELELSGETPSFNRHRFGLHVSGEFYLKST